MVIIWLMMVNDKIWLVVEPPIVFLKNLGKLKSIGIMTFPTQWKIIKFMFQTTNQ